MLDFKELWKGNHISVVSPVQYKYEAVHEPDVIITLPVLQINGNYYAVIRKEVCPPYLIKDKTLSPFYYTPITGRMDKGNETPEQTMRREVIEEAGIELIDYTIMSYRKDMPLCKTTDLRAHIYTLLVDTFKPVEATGDGTITEEMSESIFVPLGELYKIIEKPNIDFLLYGAYYILMDVIGNYIRI